jgi:hypothetical protein
MLVFERLMASRARPLVEIALGFASAVVVAADADALGAAPTASAAFAGAWLQVLGLLTVAVGIHQLRDKFQQRGVIAEASAAVREQLRRHLGKPVPITGEGHLVIGPGSYAITGSGITATHRAAPGAPVERRLDILETEVERLRDQNGQDLTEVRTGLARVDAAVVRERAERTSADTTLGDAVQELGAGGLNLQTVGLCWLVGGALLGTLPEQCAGVIGAFLGLLPGG